MMDHLECRIEWLEAAGVREEALARTFARIEVWVGDQCVTKAFNKHASTVVNGAHVSLLPLATWIVDAWWTASFEAPRSSRIGSVREARTAEQRSWQKRHGWLSSREGFAVPELVLSRGEDSAVRLDWLRDPGDFKAMPLRFLESGSALVPRDIVQHELGRIVEGTIERCEGLYSPVVDALRRRWELVRSATAGERRVCERAARLGLDAYDSDEVDNALAELLARPDVVLAEPILDDLLDVVDDHSVTKLEKQIGSLGALLQEAKIDRASAAELTSARMRMAGVQGRPYERGYERARLVRQTILGLTDDEVGDALDHAIEAALLPSANVRETLAPFPFRGVHALVAGKQAMPFVVTRPGRSSEGQRFDRARALDVLVSSETPRLITSSFDPDQQASRAFAAELLAPASYLRAHLVSPFVEQDDLERLAADLHVNAALIRHQLENHQLAEVVDGG